MVKYDGRYLIFDKGIKGDQILRYIERVAEEEDIYIKQIELLGPFNGYVRVFVYSPLINFFGDRSLEGKVFSTLIHRDQSYSEVRLRKSLLFGHVKGSREFIDSFGSKLEDMLRKDGLDGMHTGSSYRSPSPESYTS